MTITDSGGARPEVLSRRLGRCYVCGYQGSFERVHRSAREGFPCPDCRSSLRYQHQAQTIVTLLGRQRTTDLVTLVRTDSRFRELRLYEPGVIGPFRKHWQHLPGYHSSYFWPDVAPGDRREGVRCEDLEHLTFDDESFDLVVTSDIFEHVRRPWDAFASVLRVLAPGGWHVMSIPTTHPLPGMSHARVDTATNEDRLLKPAVYHGSPKDPRGSLVYTDFGADLPARLTEIGYEVSVHHGPERVFTYVMRRPA
jgi:hypothetical protein